MLLECQGQTCDHLFLLTRGTGDIVSDDSMTV